MQLTTQQLAHLIHASEKTVLRWRQLHGLPHLTGNGTPGIPYTFDPITVREWLQRRPWMGFTLGDNHETTDGS